MISVALLNLVEELLAERWDDSWLIPSTWWTEKNSRRGSVFGEEIWENMGKYGNIESIEVLILHTLWLRLKRFANLVSSVFTVKSSS